MTTLFADDIEINIEEGHWRLFKLQGANSLHPFFDVLRGSGLIEYATAFGDARGLLKAESIQLPITRSGVWIGTTRDTLNMRLSKEADQGKGLFEAPAFNQFVFDRPTQVIRLMPPTGLLGGFLGPQGRVIQL